MNFTDFLGFIIIMVSMIFLMFKKRRRLKLQRDFPKKKASDLKKLIKSMDVNFDKEEEAVPLKEESYEMPSAYEIQKTLPSRAKKTFGSLKKAIIIQSILNKHEDYR